MDDQRSSAPNELSDRPLVSDEELTRLALAADPHAPLTADAQPWDFGAALGAELLPTWYMPRAIATERGRWTKFAVVSVVAGIVFINAFGLCITAGFITVA